MTRNPETDGTSVRDRQSGGGAWRFLLPVPMQRREHVVKDVVADAPALRDRLVLVEPPMNAQIDPALTILIFSLCISFYFPQRRIWIRIQGNTVQMAALREHFINIRIDLLGITKEATQAKPRDYIL